MALRVNIVRASSRKAVDLMSYIPALQNGITTLMPFYEFYRHYFTWTDVWLLSDQVEPEDQFLTRLFPKPKRLYIDARPGRKPGVLFFSMIYSRMYLASSSNERPANGKGSQN
jgi:hypothetical protein